jgi:hypothetical protein
MAVAFGAHGAFVAQNPAHGKQINPGIYHLAGRAVPSIVQPGCVVTQDRDLPYDW